MTEQQILDLLSDNYKIDPLYDSAFQSRQIERARKKFSEYYPEKCVGYITTVANQTRYQVTGVSGLIKITKVYYGKDTSEENIDGILNTVPLQAGLPNAKSTFFPSSGFEFVQRMQILSMLVPAEAFIVSHDKFDLIPTPENTGDRIYFEYDAYRELSAFPDIFEEDFARMVMFNIKDRLFEEANMKSGSNRYTFERRGNITVDSDSVSAKKEHEESRNEILKSVERKAMKLG